MSGVELREVDYYPTLVAELASRGLTTYHTHDSRRSAEGFPDFLVPGVGRWQVAIELKKFPGPLRRPQAEWLRRLLGPWRASFLVDVGELSALLLAIDNLRAGRADQLGTTGPVVVYVLGRVKAVELLGSAAVGEYVHPVAETAGEPPATPPTQRRRGTRRPRRGW